MRGQIRKRVGKKGDVPWQLIVSLGRDPLTGKYKKKTEKKLAELPQQVNSGV